VTFTVSVRPPAVIVTVPLREAPVLAAAVNVKLPPSTPEDTDTDNHDTSGTTDQPPGTLVETFSEREPPSFGAKYVPEGDTDKLAAA
jgi:hypothetical protein